jgi:hypothetical protein
MRELTEKQVEFLDSAETILDARESDPEEPYWLMDDSDEPLCFECLKSSRKPPLLPLEWSEDIGDYFECFGRYNETDAPYICRECHKLLSYTLTDFGALEELEGMSDGYFDWADPDQCFSMARVIGALGRDPTDSRMLINVLLKGKNFPPKLKRIRSPKCCESVRG